MRIRAGISAGLLALGAGHPLEAWIVSALAMLLYGMFTQIPFLRFREAVSNGRFSAVLPVLNFAVVPAVVWGVTRFFPDSPPLLPDGDPEEVKRVPAKSFRAILKERAFNAILFTHGEPIVKGGKKKPGVFICGPGI